MFHRNFVKLALLFGSAAALNSLNRRIEDTQYLYLNQEQQDQLRKTYEDDIRMAIRDMEPRPCVDARSLLRWHHPMFYVESSTKRIPCAFSPKPTHPVRGAFKSATACRRNTNV